MTSVTVLCPNARRVKLSVTPGKQLRQVLEEACLAQGYDADGYELQHGGKALDGSLPFRLTGLPNNATLELVPSTRVVLDAEVEIALQTADGRKIRKFPNSATLAELLQAFSEDFSADLTAADDGMAPAINYLNSQWKGLTQLASTTLKSIGITSGRALLRYSAVQLSDAERAEIEAALEAEASRRRKLEENFERQKAENEARLALEVKYQREFDERQKLAEEEAAAKLSAESATATETVAEVSTMTASGTSDGTSAASSTTTSAATSTGTTTSTLSEIERLEATLNVLNSSIATGRSDSLVDSLMTERGTLRTDVEMTDLTEAARRPFVPPVVNEFANFKFPDKKIVVPYDIQEDPKDKEIHFTAPESRNAVHFDRTIPEERRKEVEEVDDAVYETTVHDLKALQRGLNDQARSERAFVPRAFIDAQNRQRKLDAYKNTVIRFLLPENQAIQACFYSKEPVSRVFEFIESILAVAVPFELCFFLREKLTNSNSTNLIDAGLAPKSNLIVKMSLPSETAAFKDIPMVSLDEADLASTRWLAENGVFTPYVPSAPRESQTVQNKRAAETEIAAGGPSRRPEVSGLPKWLKR
uniref:UBX domain-containing protein n=1 Tax=Panagrellus redivivus TaxID=6233 RepID=A0A7E4VBG9_PANRE